MASKSHQLPKQIAQIMKGLTTTIPSQLLTTIESISQNKASGNNQQELKMIQQARIKQVRNISTISRKKSTQIKQFKEVRIHKMSIQDPEESQYNIGSKSPKKKKISKRPRLLRLMSQQLPQTLIEPQQQQLYPLSPQISNPEPNYIADIQQINFDSYFQIKERPFIENWFQQQKHLNDNFF